MNLYLRLLYCLFTNLFKGKLHYTDSVESQFRVWPHDLDVFGHMNNGRYLQIMDVARVDWMSRTGVTPAILKNSWAPILGGGLICFRRSMHLMQRYDVRSRLLCWDKRWFYLEHSFLDTDSQLIAVGVSRAGLRGKRSWVPAAKVAESVSPDAFSPAFPDYLTRWLRIEKEMVEFSSLDNQPHSSEIA